VKRRKSTEKVFPRIEGHLHPDAEVVILGNASRSWYEDRGRIAELLLLLNDYGVAPTVIGAQAFLSAVRYALEEVGDVVTVLMLLTDDDPCVERVVSAAQACFVFTSRVKDSVYDANPWLMRYAVEGGPRPALGIRPDGSHLLVELASTEPS
jgi:hypothetical protein